MLEERETQPWWAVEMHREGQRERLAFEKGTWDANPALSGLGGCRTPGSRTGLLETGETILEPGACDRPEATNAPNHT